MKTAVITGAGRGIGRATAKKFLDEGWMVIGTFHKNPIPFADPRIVAVELDLSSPGSIDGAVRKIRERGGKIDVLVNNAGVIFDSGDVVADADKVRKTLDVNVVGTIDLTEKLLPLLAEGGRVVNIDSAYGSFSMPIDDETSTGYRISKAALNMYTRTLAFRLKKREIAVSSLDPGWVNTDMGNAVASETEKPDREPEQAADDIYRLATSSVPSGRFWRFGKERAW